MPSKLKVMAHSTFIDVIDLWPNAAVLAAEIGVTHAYVRQWRMKNYIPAKYFLAISKAARKRKIYSVTVALLKAIAKLRKVEEKSAASTAPAGQSASNGDVSCAPA